MPIINLNVRNLPFHQSLVPTLRSTSFHRNGTIRDISVTSCKPFSLTQVDGFINEAETAFESLKAGKENLSARADFWMRRKGAAKARSLLEEITGGDPGNIDAITRLAEIYTGQSEFSKALDLLDRALKGDLKKPDRERVLLSKAIVKAKENDFESAKSICEVVLGENQTNMDGHLLLGKTLDMLHKEFN